MTQVRRAATLPVAFFTRPTEVVARELLGMVVVSTAGGELTAARIVETEAYLGRDDPASHGYLHRRNTRNEALFGPPGSWYVYLSYGMHWCANLVCQRTGSGRSSAAASPGATRGAGGDAPAPGTRGRPRALFRARKAVPGIGHHSRPGWPEDAQERGPGASAAVERSRAHRGDTEDRDYQSSRLATQVCGGRVTLALAAGLRRQGPGEIIAGPLSLRCAYSTAGW